MLFSETYKKINGNVFESVLETLPNVEAVSAR